MIGAQVQQQALHRVEELATPQSRSGWDVIDGTVRVAFDTMPSEVRAVFAIGSLAHGGFVDAVSDVDVALIVDDSAANASASVASLMPAVCNLIPTPIARRLSVFWATWSDLISQTKRGRFPLIDQIDLVESGVLLGGEDRRSEIALPSGGQRGDLLVIESAEFALKVLATPERTAPLRDAERLIALGRRTVSKAVTFPLRFLYTVDTGSFAKKNVSALEHYEHVRKGPALALARAAFRWREQGYEDEAEMASLLRAELPLLYDELATSYAEPLERLGRADLSALLAQWAASIRQQ